MHLIINISVFFLFQMSPRPKKYASEEEAYEAKKIKSRARYWERKGTTERERVGVINYVITAEDVGLTIREIKERLKQDTRPPVIVDEPPAEPEPEPELDFDAPLQ
jgi:hypothetical protein